jgi:hypothetical protein
MMPAVMDDTRVSEALNEVNHGRNGVDRVADCGSQDFCRRACRLTI